MEEVRHHFGVRQIFKLLGAGAAFLIALAVVMWFLGFAPVVTKRFLDIHSGRERLTTTLYGVPIREYVKETEFSRIAIAQGLAISRPLWVKFATYTWPDDGRRSSSDTGHAFSQLKTLCGVFELRKSSGLLKTQFVRAIMPRLSAGSRFSVDYDSNGDPVGIDGIPVIVP